MPPNRPEIAYVGRVFDNLSAARPIENNIKKNKHTYIQRESCKQIYDFLKVPRTTT
jgi:hypothetical protein